MKSRSYIVNVNDGSFARARVWDSRVPLGLGLPLAWILEGTPGGVRLRSLEGGQVSEVAAVEDERPRSLELRNGERRLELSIRAVQPMQAACEPRGERAGAGSVLRAFAWRGTALEGGTELGRIFEGRAGRKPLFRVEKVIEAQGGGYCLHCLGSGLRLDEAGAPDSPDSNVELPAGSKRILSGEELLRASVRSGARRWVFSLSGEAPVLVPREPEKDKEFRKAMQYSAAIVTALLVLAFLGANVLPARAPEPQFVKLDLNELALPPHPPVRHHLAVALPTVPVAQHATVKSLKAPQVPQHVARAIGGGRPAIPAGSLERLAARTVRGGMTSLLKSGPTLAGDGRAEGARGLLGSRPGTLRQGRPHEGDVGSESAQVAALGGEGALASEHNPGVGYGKGERARLSGQGKGFVAVDPSRTSVEDGLSKDEVGEVIHRHLSEVRYCYESSMVREPDIEGKLLMAFTIGASGTVRVADVRSSTLRDPMLNDCVLRRLVTWHFPATHGGVNVSVSYPFIFKTLGG